MRKLKVIPQMRCDDACGECCGVVPATETEFRAVERHARAKGVEARDQEDTCPFFQEGRCAVYEVRPLACRLFGHTPGMECPRGHNVNMPEHDVARMVRSNGPATRVLHELVPGWSERVGAWRARRLLEGA